MDPGLARLARHAPCTIRRWLQAPTGYDFFLWKGQPRDAPANASWTTDDDVLVFTPPTPLNPVDVGTFVVYITSYPNVPGPEYPGNLATNTNDASATMVGVYYLDTQYGDWSWAWFNLRAGDTVSVGDGAQVYQVLGTPTAYSSGHAFQFPARVISFSPIANASALDANLHYANLTPSGIFFAPMGLPGGTADSNNGPITAGCEFVSTAAGKNIIGVYFYKLSTETLTTHQAGIWRSSDSALLASFSFTNETFTGWQYCPLSTPVPIAANVPFRVGVYFPTTHYGNCVSGVLPPGGSVQGTYTLSDMGWYHLGTGMTPPTSSAGGFYYLCDIVTDG